MGTGLNSRRNKNDEETGEEELAAGQGFDVKFSELVARQWGADVFLTFEICLYITDSPQWIFRVGSKLSKL